MELATSILTFPPIPVVNTLTVSATRTVEICRFDERTFDVIPPPAKLFAEMAPVPIKFPVIESSLITFEALREFTANKLPVI